MQLVAYGAQDIYLTGNPQITFFKVVYRRHTNFSMETIEQTISGASTTAGGTGTVTISRNGDLVHKVYVTSATASIEDGDEIVAEVELEIGGQRIDRHYKEWNQIWNELSTPESKAVGLKSMKGCIGSSGGTGAGMVQVPLNFWFCRNPGLALPLIALQYHEVKLKFTWGDGAADVGVADAACKVFCDYIYLDTDERRRFAQVSHEYLIEQVQKQSATASTSTKLNFNHPVKELIWTSAATNTYTDAKLVLNGHDRFSKQEEEYFQLRQPYDYHTAVPRQNLPFQAHSTISTEQHVQLNSAGEVMEAAANAGTNGVTATATKKVTIGVTTNTTFGTLASTDTINTSTGAAADQTAIKTTYCLKTSTLNVSSFSVGDIVICNLTGTASFAPTVITRVADILDGAVAAGTNRGNSADTHFRFEDPLLTLSADDGDEIVSAAEFQIQSIVKLSDNKARTSKMTKKVNVYSFALKPEEHQPSGTCNFSRIDNAKLVTGNNLAAADNIYAVNYNVLRIMSGMGGLAYSN